MPRTIAGTCLLLGHALLSFSVFFAGVLAVKPVGKVVYRGPLLKFDLSPLRHGGGWPRFFEQSSPALPGGPSRGPYRAFAWGVMLQIIAYLMMSETCA